MKRYVALLFAIFSLPAAAALLHFDLRGEFEADFDPPIRGPLSVSYDLNAGLDQPIFADTTAPDGALARDYFVGTGEFSIGIPSTSPETLGALGPLTVQFGSNEPLLMKPFTLTQSISPVAFNVYRYSFETFVSEPLFGFLRYELLFSPPSGVAFWDQALVDALADPVLLLASADLAGASGIFELGQLGILAEFSRVSITQPGAAAIPEPGSVLLAGVALLALWREGRRRRAGRAPAPAPMPPGRIP